MTPPTGCFVPDAYHPRPGARLIGGSRSVKTSQCSQIPFGKGIWEHKGVNWPLWANTDQYRTIWANMNPYGPLWTHVGQYGQYKPIWIPFCLISSQLRPFSFHFHFIWTHMGLFPAATLPHFISILFGHIWASSPPPPCLCLRPPCPWGSLGGFV